MTVEEALEKAVARLHAGQLTNEAQIKQAIVIPILRALDWDDTDPNEVKPDHRVRDGNAGSVDYALFQEGNALIFIIASPLGNVTPAGVEPIFELSARNGVPFLIVTDGKTWDFFLGKAVGIPQERRFLRIELQPDRIDKNAHLLGRFLRKGSVSGKQAILEAERLLGHDRDRRIAQNAIPDVWTSLVDDDDDQATVDPVFRETLYDVIKGAVRERCGRQPANEDVKGFLKGLSKYRPDKSDACQTEESGPVSPSGFNLVRWRHNNKIVGFDFDGMPTITNAASRTLAELVRRFQEIDPDFINRLKEPLAKLGSERI